MSDDLIARLRSPEEIVFPAGTQIAIHGGTISALQPFSMWSSSSSDRLEAADEIARLRARVKELEKVRAAAQALIDEDAGDDPAEDGWWEWEKNCEALRAALKEVKP